MTRKREFVRIYEKWIYPYLFSLGILIWVFDFATPVLGFLESTRG